MEFCHTQLLYHARSLEAMSKGFQLFSEFDEENEASVIERYIYTLTSISDLDSQNAK